jgi:hypothetical protein
MQFLLSKTGFHVRLCRGGIGVVNLANLAGYTVYPGVAEIPGDSWIAEPPAHHAAQPPAMRAGVQAPKRSPSERTMP